MKPNPQQEYILSFLRDREWHCGLEWLDQVKDDRARITHLNKYYLNEKGFKIVGEHCNKHEHKGNFFMRKVEKIEKGRDIQKEMDLFWKNI